MFALSCLGRKMLISTIGLVSKQYITLRMCSGCSKLVRYTTRHEWISVDENIGVVGMTEYAAGKLGDVIFIQLPEAGSKISQDAECGAVESVKSATDIYSPVSGVIQEVNKDVKNKPSILNKSPEDKGWLFKVVVDDPKELHKLMTQSEYLAFLDEDEVL